MEQAFRVGEWQVRPDLGTIIRDDKKRQLEPKIMAVLEYLAQHPGEVLSKERLLQAVWPDTFVGEDVLYRALFELRKAFGDSVQNPSYIRTLPRRGFQLVAEVVFPTETHQAATGGRSQATVQPYPGLASFQVEQARYFFGREIETEMLWKKLASSRLLGMIGPTGSGKSSFVRAGLTPAAPEGWAVIVATPGSRPLMGLAEALSGQVAGDERAVRRLLHFEDEGALLSLVSMWRQRHDDVLIVVDQFEELFTLNAEVEQQRFARFVGRLVDECDAHLLLAMRDDFLVRCHGLKGLESVFSDLTPIGPLARTALRRALVEPAALYGFQFESEALVNRILEEVEGGRGALPLMAFAAARLWECRDRDRKFLTENAYERIGGVGGALGLHAEAALEEIGLGRIPIVRELFRNLVTAEGTRTVQDRGELLSVFEEEGRAEAKRVLEMLLKARLLVSYRSPAGHSEDKRARRIEIVHESLLSNWPRLSRWKSQDAEGARLRDALLQSARTWDKRGRPQDLLWTGTTLREHELWRGHYPGGLTDLEEAFSEAALGYARRRSRITRLALAAVVLVALIAGLVTTTMWRRATNEARRAEAAHLLTLAKLELQAHPTAAIAYATKSLELADHEITRQLIAEVFSRGPIAFTRPAQNEGLALEFSPDGQWLALGGWQGFHQLWHSNGGPPIQLPAYGEDSLLSDRFSLDGSFLVSWDRRWKSPLRVLCLPEFDLVRTVKVIPETDYFVQPRGICTLSRSGDRVVARLLPFDASGEAKLGSWQWTPEGPYRVQFGADETVHLVSSRGRDLYALEGTPSRVGEPRHLGEAEAAIRALRFQPDERVVASLNAEDTIELWSLAATSAPPLRVFRDNTELMGDSWHWDDGSEWMGMANGTQGTASVWDLLAPAGTEPLVLRRGRTASTFGLAMHPRGDWVAVADSGGISFWPLQHSYPRVLFRHPESLWLSGLAIDPDGEWVAAPSWDAKLRIWTLTPRGDGLPKVLYQGPGRSNRSRASGEYLLNCVVSPDGEYIAVGHFRGSVAVVPVDGGRVRRFGGFRSAISALAFSDSGSKLAAAAGSQLADDALILVWDLKSGGVQVLDPGDEAAITWLQFRSEDRLFSSGPGGLRLWDLSAGSSRLLIAQAAGSVSPDGSLYLAITPEKTDLGSGEPTIYNLETGDSWSLTSHGKDVVGVGWHPSGESVITTTRSGVIQIGRTNGEAPRLLFGHSGLVRGISVDKSGKSIFSAGNDGTLRIWSMPDLSRPPLYTLPDKELLQRLYSLTNLRAVEDENSLTGYQLSLDPFPGWENVPEWSCVLLSERSDLSDLSD